ncbi:MAG: histidinol dehydrogenase [Desulfobacteraceae bacterium]|nr:histidinol dehydrogenase [Desulfobacteraceae bacterium]
MQIYKYPSQAAQKRLDKIVNRGLGFKRKDLSAVQRIVEDVRKRGDQALIDYVRRFDAPEIRVDQLQVTGAEIQAAAGKVGQTFIHALDRAAEQIKAFHQLQRPKSWIETPRAGTLLGQLVRAVEAAGVYVPGGKGGQTPLVSSVLMGAIPAKIAGVEQIVMTTPPMKDGSVNPYLLIAAQKAGVDRILKIGSAWAIAALAFGTLTVPKVDVIVGPGNIYVTLAKKLVSGTVKIDMIAGPSEILILADDSADPDFIAADMLSQAEHDVLASAVLVTDSLKLAGAVRKALKQQIDSLSRREIAGQSLKQFGALIVVPDLDTAVDIANRIAPEHLELHLRQPFDMISRIRHAGAIFIGPHTPEPVGDYIAGPNHVLPTAGTARFSSALSVEHFLKKSSLIHYSQQAFQDEARQIIRLAEIEGLDGHARSVKIRLEKSGN